MKQNKPIDKQKMRAMISNILSFLLSLNIVIVFLLIGFYLGVFNNHVILKSLEKSNYYESKYNIVLNNLELILLPYGLNASILDNVIVKSSSYNEARKAMQAATVQGQTITPDTKNLQKQLEKMILTFAMKNNVKSLENQQNGINALCKSITSEYTKMFNFSYIKYYVKYKKFYLKAMIISFIVLLTIVSLICVFLFSLHKNNRNAFRYIAYSTLAATMMITIIPMLLLITGFYKNLNLAPKYFYDFMVSYARLSIIQFIYIGGVGAAISAVFILLAERKRSA